MLNLRELKGFRRHRLRNSVPVSTSAQLDQVLEIELPTHTDSPIRFKWPSTFAP